MYFCMFIFVCVVCIFEILHVSSCQDINLIGSAKGGSHLHYNPYTSSHNGLNTIITEGSTHSDLETEGTPCVLYDCAH